MPDIDFTQIDDVQDFTPLPDGTYQCRVAEVEETATQHGDEMWKLRFEVVKGEHSGRHVFDNMVFSAAAHPRVKLICSSLGFDVSGKLSRGIPKPTTIPVTRIPTASRLPKT